MKLDFFVPKSFSPELKDFVKGILIKDPENRPTISDVLNHKWLKMNVAAFRENEKVKNQSLTYFN